MEKIDQFQLLIDEGISHEEENDYDEAIKSYEYALSAAKEIYNKMYIAEANDKLGNVYIKISRYDTALKYYLFALTLYEQLDEKIGIAKENINIGITYEYRNDYSRAIENFKNALEIYRKVDCKQGISEVLNNCGAINLKLGRINEAKDFYKESLQISKELGEKQTLSNTLSNIGIAYMEEKDFENALQYFKQALEIEEIMDSVREIAYTKFRIAKCYYQFGKCREAISIADYALRSAVDVKDKLLQSYLNMLFSNIYEKLEDYKKALKYYKEYSRINEELFNDNSSRIIAEMQAKYDLYKKEKEKEIIKLQNVKLQKANKILQEAYKKVKILSQKDFLTKVSNRRHITEVTKMEIARVKQNSKPFSIIMADIDDFKKINDKYGHYVGDYVLVESVERIKKAVRKTDLIARWGGEEFLIILPETDEEEGKIVAEKIRERIEETKFRCDNILLSVTMTLGVSEFNEDYDFNECINFADKALYKGKASGKNCVNIFKAN